MGDREYTPPAVLSVKVAPDITRSMQNTGGIEASSTFRVYQDIKEQESRDSC